MNPTALDDIRACLRFYTRLPVSPGGDGYAMPDFNRVCWATPVAGALIGAIGACVLLLAHAVRLPGLVAAGLAVGALALTTGALHEDGLADVADGFGGGDTRDRKLAIMRDSRLGSYGALALVVSTAIRMGALASMVEHGMWGAAVALVAASALSRAVGLIPLATMRPARKDGAGSAAASPSAPPLRMALVVGVAIALTPALGPATLAQTVIAVMAGFAAAIGVGKLAERQIGGYTGDVLGAAQQAAEIAALAALSAA